MISVLPYRPAPRVAAFPAITARSNDPRTSLGRSGAPFEYVTPDRSWNVQVRPPSGDAGIDDARSGTSVWPSGPPTFLYATRASFVMSASPRVDPSTYDGSAVSGKSPAGL